MARAFVFPGQGSQAVGMGQAMAAAFPAARQALEEVDDALSQNLSRLMAQGPADELTLTENAQPALMAVSLAVLRVLEAEAGVDMETSCKFVAGHSLGEYSALAAARGLDIADAARLLKRRGQSMQEAVPIGVGAMAALLGAELDQARELAADAAQGDVCETANDNADGQIVISGHKIAIDRAIELAPERGIRRAIELPVSAPFHCSLMQPAAEIMEQALGEIDVRRPVVPVIANVSAAEATRPDDIRDLLVKQVTAMVRWRECVLAMRDAGVDTLVELGAGKVLTGLARRIDRDMTAISIEGPDDIEALVKIL
ncbi:MAG: ACP S-malonyltransferase [Pseudomonadota bacterium]|nr:ACP S-malonyltransferase [Pseudomonadota bacterium]